MPISKKEYEKIEAIMKNKFLKARPNACIHVYKVRRGKYNKIRVYCYLELGTCRITDLFTTNNDYELIDIEHLDIVKILEDTSSSEVVNLFQEEDE